MIIIKTYINKKLQMKTIKKISAILLIWVFSTSSLFATWFPDEPMVIYWDVIGNQNDSLKIYDWDNTLIKEVLIKSWKYWTEKTFNNADKIKLENFSWKLVFKIWDTIGTTTRWETNNCGTTPLFQKWWICQYNLTFEDTIIDEPIITIPDFIADSFIVEPGNEATVEEDIFNWKVFKKTKSNLIKQKLKDLFDKVWESKEIVLLSKKIKIGKNISKNLAIISSDEKQSIFIPENTDIIEEDVEIEVPEKINNTDFIKSKIKKDILWAIKIPTNKSINFKNDIRVCTDVIKDNSKKMTIYYSQDGIRWSQDYSANNIKVSYWQVCFYTSHLTSFAIWQDQETTTNSSNSNNSSNTNNGWTSNSSSKWWYSKKATDTNLTNNTIDEDISYNPFVNSSEESVDKTNVIVDNTSIQVENETNIETRTNNQNNSDFDWNNYIFTEVKIDSKTYIRNLKAFKQTNEAIENISWHKVIKLKWNTEYNKKIDLQAIQVFDNIKLKSIRESLIQQMNKMNTVYWILNNNDIDEVTRKIYNDQLNIAQNNFIFKLEKLKFKDMVVRKALEKRRFENNK